MSARITPFNLISFLLLFIGICWPGRPCTAATFMPVVTNYTPQEYGAGLQNWAITQGENGEIYIGNNTGLLCFDGYTWSKYPMPGNQLVRSLLADGDRIYAGTYEDFGYFTRTASGLLEYTSLWDEMENTETHNDEIWNILKVGDCIYFQSFSSWFKYDGKHITAHYRPNQLPLYFHEAHGRIYVQMVNGDFYLLENDGYKPLIERSELNDASVVAVIPAAGDKMILCTEWQGLFVYDGKSVAPYPTAIDSELKSQQLNRAVWVPSDSTLVLGTIRNGIYAIDNRGNEKWHYDVNNRLYNNSVLRLFCDRSNNVWAALDIGIALIRTSSPYSVLIPHRNAQPFGMVYGANVADGKLYIATNQSAWMYDLGGQTIVPIRGTEGQNWHVTAFGRQILVGNNLGTKIIRGTEAVNLPETENSSTCLRRCRINGQDILIESSYYKFRIYRKENGRWQYAHTVDGFQNPVRQFEVDHTGTIWAAHMSLGIYKIALSKDLTKAEKCVYIKSLSDEKNSASLMHVMKIRGRVVLSDSERTYTFDDINQRIIPFTRLNAILPNGVNTAVPVDDATYWLTDYRGYTLIKYESDTFRIERFVPSSFFGLECNENNNNVHVDGSITYFCLNNGIGRLDTEAEKGALPEPGRLTMGKVTSLSQDRSLYELPVSAGKKAAGEIRGDITFRLSYPNFDCEPLLFCYRLTGNGLDVASESAHPAITYGSLGYGAYRFTASVKNVQGAVLSSTEYYFRNPRPFYLSVYAWIFYLLLIGALIYFYSRWHTAHMLRKRQRELEEEKIKQDFKILEQEHIIAQQREQLLEAELQVKSKELASLALDAVVQHKTVANLKTAMLEQKRKGDINQQEVDRMLNQIGGNLNDEEFWDIYHKNFDLIHKNFFRNLRKQYPNLTPNDLRFCALLRLNLSTKDIAQFTNLTVRGIETARYRLRKKLAIPEGKSLVDFFIDFV